MSIPLRRHADDPVRTVVTMASAPRPPAFPSGGGSGPGFERPDVADHPRLPLSSAVTARQERTP